MWFENLWNTPLFWWLLLAAFLAVVIITALVRRNRTDAVKDHLDHFCRCYARGELSRDDFEELKKDLHEFEKQIKTTKNENQHPV